MYAKVVFFTDLMGMLLRYICYIHMGEISESNGNVTLCPFVTSEAVTSPCPPVFLSIQENH